MFPNGELQRLSARKALVRVRIATHRWQCVEAGTELARPLVTIDGWIVTWRRISPLAKIIGVPLGLMLLRRLMRRFRHLTAIVRSAPLIFQTARMVAGWE